MVGPFVSATRIQHAPGYITWKMDGGPAAAGQIIKIYAARKTTALGKWTAVHAPDHAQGERGRGHLREHPNGRRPLAVDPAQPRQRLGPDLDRTLDQVAPGFSWDAGARSSGWHLETQTRNRTGSRSGTRRLLKVPCRPGGVRPGTLAVSPRIDGRDRAGRGDRSPALPRGARPRHAPGRHVRAPRAAGWIVGQSVRGRRPLPHLETARGPLATRSSAWSWSGSRRSGWPVIGCS